MKIKVNYLWACLLLSSCATDFDDAGIEPITYPFDIGEIQSIDITEYGVSSVDASDSSNNCNSFILTQAEVDRFFKETMTVNEGDYRHMLDWSPCHTAGSLTLNNGLTANWAIHRFKAGSIVFNNGKTIHLYCRECTAKAFDLE